MLNYGQKKRTKGEPSSFLSYSFMQQYAFMFLFKKYFLFEKFFELRNRHTEYQTCNDDNTDCDRVNDFYHEFVNRCQGEFESAVRSSFLYGFFGVQTQRHRVRRTVRPEAAAVCLSGIPGSRRRWGIRYRSWKPRYP